MKRSVFLSCNQILLVMMQENHPRNDADYAKHNTACESTANCGEASEHAKPTCNDGMSANKDDKHSHVGCCDSGNRGEY